MLSDVLVRASVRVPEACARTCCQKHQQMHRGILLHHRLWWHDLFLQLGVDLRRCARQTIAAGFAGGGDVAADLDTHPSQL